MTLYYIEELRNHGYIREYKASAMAKSFKDAYKEFDDYAYVEDIRYFMVSQEKPIVNKDGSLSYNGCLFCNYSDCFHQVY